MSPGRALYLRRKVITAVLYLSNPRKLGAYSRGRNEVLPDQHPAHDQPDDDEDDRKLDKGEAFCRTVRRVPLQHLLCPCVLY